MTNDKAEVFMAFSLSFPLTLVIFNYFIRSYNREWRIQYDFFFAAAAVALFMYSFTWTLAWLKYCNEVNAIHRYRYKHTHTKRVVNIHLYENRNANDIRSEKTASSTTHVKCKRRFDGNQCAFFIHFCCRSSRTSINTENRNASLYCHR